MSRSWLLNCALLTAVTGCGTPSASDSPDLPVPLDPAGCLAHSSGQVDLALSDGAPQAFELVVSNGCEHAVGISDVYSDSELFSFDVSGAVVPAEGELAVEGLFSPPHSGSFPAEVRVRVSSDPTEDLVVGLLASLPGGYLEISEPEAPSSLFVGCDSAREVVLQNTGDRPVTVLGAALTGSEFELVDFEPGLVVPPGSSGAIVLRATAGIEGAIQSVLTVQTDEVIRSELKHALTQEAEYAPPVELTEVVEFTALDVLLTMDRSSCNTEHHETVPEAIESFRTAMKDRDYRLSIVVADSGCVVGETPYIDASMSAKAAAAAASAMIDMEFVASPYGANTERGFTLADAALSCETNALREDAFLHIIHHSDEPEQSLRPWSYYVDRFRDLKDGAVMQHGVVGPASTGCESAAPGVGYNEAIAETGGLDRSICDTVDGEWTPDWEGHFAAFASHMLDQDGSHIELPRPPLPGATIEVSVNGAATTEGWRYDVEQNSIVLDLTQVGRGDEIRVRYQAAPETCP